MTRQDYELIAKVISDLPDKPTKVNVAAAFSYALANENHRFKSSRFIEACFPECVKGEAKK